MPTLSFPHETENRSSAITKRITLSARIDMMVTMFLVFLGFAICGISIIYLSYSNSVATKGYALKELEKERSYLITVNESWNMRLSQARSIQTISESPVVQAMIPNTKKPKFMYGDSAVAVKK